MMSEIAGDALAQVLEYLNLEVNRRLGLVSGPTVRTIYREVEGVSSAPSPSIRGVHGSRNYPHGLPQLWLAPWFSGFHRPRAGRLRRLFASPLGRGQYFAGVLLYILALR